MRHYYIIETRYLRPTNYLGARVSAKRLDGYGRRVVIPWDHALNTSGNHEKVARILLADFDGHVITGSTDTANGLGYVVDAFPAA